MRIVLLNSVRGQGGGVTAAVTLARGLAVDHDVTVACSASGEIPDRLRGDDVHIAPFRTGPDYDPFAAATFLRIVRGARADVVLLDRRKDVKIFFLASLLGLRVPAVHRHGAPSELRDSRLYRAAWGRMRAMIVNSDAMRRQLRAATPWLRDLPIEVVHNGVDLERFRPLEDRGPVRAELGIPPNRFVIGFAGVLQPRKRVDLLIRAVAAMPADPAPHLLLIGDGVQRPELERVAADLGVSSTFAGHSADPARWIAAADCAAHLSAAEGFANSVLEALACGLPVVATDEHSHPEQIDEGETGLLVAPDVRSVADALARIARDPDLRHAMSRAARAIAVSRFSIPHMVDDYVRVLAGIVDAPSVSR